MSVNAAASGVERVDWDNERSVNAAASGVERGRLGQRQGL